MTRRDHTFALAMTASLLLHAGTLLVLAGKYGDGTVAAPSARMFTAAAVPREAAPRFEFTFGDARGAGDASNTRPGDDPMVMSRVGAQQPFLSRDPIGAGRVGDEPSMSVLPRGAVDTPPPPPAAPPAPVLGVSKLAQPLPPPQTKRRAIPQKPSAESTAPPADPAIMSDSESDPFTKQPNSVEFRDGQVDVRFGRKVKTVRPRLSLAAEIDLMSLRFPNMVVRLHVTPAGEVRKVDIVKSTGSDGADQDVKIALYQWWVEPAKNAAGVAVADTVEFPITWK